MRFEYSFLSETLKKHVFTIEKIIVNNVTEGLL